MVRKKDKIVIKNNAVYQIDATTGKMQKIANIVIKGDTVYEMNVFSGRPRRIVHGVSNYFKRIIEEGESEEEQEFNYHNRLNSEDDDEISMTHYTSPNERRKQLLKLIGNKKKLVEKADGLDKEIAIDETEHEIIKKKAINDRYRKKKSSKKPKRKVCKCKK
jgi:hypothetical protein